jgi:hypothetical protein
MLQELEADALGDERGNQDVRVKHNSHDT